MQKGIVSAEFRGSLCLDQGPDIRSTSVTFRVAAINRGRGLWHRLIYLQSGLYVVYCLCVVVFIPFVL